MESNTLSFNDLLLINIPEVVQRILVTYQNYQDLSNCRLVCRLWHSYFTEVLLAKASVARAVAAKRLAFLWTRGVMTSTPIDLSPNPPAGNFSFLCSSSSDVVALITKHGQRKGVLLVLDHRGGAVRARRELDLGCPLSGVIATPDRLIIVSSQHQQEPVVFDRRTLEILPEVDLVGAKRLQAATGDGAVYNFLRRSGSSDAFVLRRLETEGDGKMRRYREVRLLMPHADCPVAKRTNAVGDRFVLMACRHGVVQLFDHVKDHLLWCTSHLRQEANSLHEVLTSNRSYTAVVYSNHQHAANEYVIHLQDLQSGRLARVISFQAHARPVVAASDRFFVFGRREMEEPDDRMMLFTVIRSERIGKEEQFKIPMESTFQRSEIWQDRILILHCYVGPPLQRAGELRIFDLAAEDIGSSERIIRDLKYGGPLNQKLLNFISDSSFVVQRNDGNTGKHRLEIVTLGLGQN